MNAAVSDLLSIFFDSVLVAFITVLAPCIAALLLVAASIVGFAGSSRLQILRNAPALVAFTAFGVVLGYFTGNSKAAVAQALLPALLTFVAGMAAYLARLDTTRAWRGLLPYWLCSMFFATLLSVTLGMAAKATALHYEESSQRSRVEYEQLTLAVQREQLLANLKTSNAKQEIPCCTNACCTKETR